MNDLNQKEKRSFGIIPIFEDYDGYKVLVVQNAKGGYWGFPKGTPEKDEEPMQTAIRELWEETGIKKDDITIQSAPELIERHPFIKDNEEYIKVNTYRIGFVSKDTIGDNLDEIIEARWVTLTEAKKLFTINSIIDIANQVEEYLESLQEHNW